MNPTPDQIAAIRAFAAALPGGLATSPPDLAAAANAPTLDDASAPPVPVPFSTGDLMASLTHQSIAGLADNPNLPRILEHVGSNDRPACLLWIQTLGLAGKISVEEAAALTEVVTATIPAPKVGWARLNLGRDLDQLDALAALET